MGTGGMPQTRTPISRCHMQRTYTQTSSLDGWSLRQGLDRCPGRAEAWEGEWGGENKPQRSWAQRRPCLGPLQRLRGYLEWNPSPGREAVGAGAIWQRLPGKGVGQRHRNWWQGAVGKLSPRESNTEEASSVWLLAKPSHRIGLTCRGGTPYPWRCGCRVWVTPQGLCTVDHQMLRMEALVPGSPFPHP